MKTAMKCPSISLLLWSVTCAGPMSNACGKYVSKGEAVKAGFRLQVVCGVTT